MKKPLILSLILILNLFISCVSSDMAYEYNYPGDSAMQERMENEYGNSF